METIFCGLAKKIQEDLSVIQVLQTCFQFYCNVHVVIGDFHFECNTWH